jgi:omega-hydroxy-beta-dihydromenaquinone-9 sulfotransferase
MLSRMLMTWLAIGRTFHRWVGPFFIALFLLIHHGIVTVAMLFDHLLFPSLRRTHLRNPVVIVGNPRSGTTFLHRFLVGQGLGAGMQVWKMLHPSLTQQAVLKPLLPLLNKFSPTRFHAQAAHDTNLTSVETDDPAVLFRYFDGFFLYGFFLAWADRDPLALFDPANRDTSKRDFRWYEALWRRNLAGEKKDRVIAKLFSLGVRLPRFMESFPDARILYMIRDPRATVPSGMSLLTGVLDQAFGFWSMPEEKRRNYLDRLYGAFLDLSMRFHDDYKSGKFDPERLMIVPYQRMMDDFGSLMDDVLGFLDIQPSEALAAAIRTTAEKQRGYKSKHAYDLEKFGLKEEQILKDYKKIYETFQITI